MTQRKLEQILTDAIDHISGTATKFSSREKASMCVRLGAALRAVKAHEVERKRLERLVKELRD